MKYIKDIILNYNSVEDNKLEFYEWDKKDKYYQVDKIPIIKINNIQYREINNNKIIIDKNILIKIKNKTYTDRGILEYALLVSDDIEVMGLLFNKEGELIKRSSLIYDEEEDILKECSNINIELLEYKIDKCNNNMLLISREDKRIRKIIIDRLEYLYKNKDYDEIRYLYYEIYNNKKNIYEEYNILLNEIKNNYKSEYKIIYDIIMLNKTDIIY